MEAIFFPHGKVDTSAFVACVTTDQLIPLAMFVVVHGCIPRLASMIFYMEHFSFDVAKTSELK
jgi:hypothetical protein